ncbi:MAG: hypothetical protein AAB787_00690 [Patescibacteria group bacterium]
MAKLAYDYSNEELVHAFSKAVARAGVSNSGLVIDIMAGQDRSEAIYLRGVLLSRLDGKERPFTQGDRVRLSEHARHYVASRNTGGESYYSRGKAETGKTYEVFRTFYEGSGEWSIYFVGDEEYRYPAEHFKKVEENKTNAPAIATA